MDLLNKFACAGKTGLIATAVAAVGTLCVGVLLYNMQLAATVVTVLVAVFILVAMGLVLWVFYDEARDVGWRNVYKNIADQSTKETTWKQETAYAGLILLNLIAIISFMDSPWLMMQLEVEEIGMLMGVGGMILMAFLVLACTLVGVYIWNYIDKRALPDGEERFGSMMIVQTIPNIALAIAAQASLPVTGILGAWAAGQVLAAACLGFYYQCKPYAPQG